MMAHRTPRPIHAGVYMQKKEKTAKKLADFPGPIAFYRGAGTIEVGKGQYAVVFNTEWDEVDKAMKGLAKKVKKETEK